MQSFRISFAWSFFSYKNPHSFLSTSNLSNIPNISFHLGCQEVRDLSLRLYIMSVASVNDTKLSEKKQGKKWDQHLLPNAFISQSMTHLIFKSGMHHSLVYAHKPISCLLNANALFTLLKCTILNCLLHLTWKSKFWNRKGFVAWDSVVDIPNWNKTNAFH